MNGAARSSMALCAALALGACVAAGAQGLESYNFTDYRGEPTTIDCTTGPDGRARAQASLAVLDAGFQQLEQEIRTRTEARLNGGPEFGSSQLIRLSQNTGLQLARRIEADHGCYLQG